MLDQESQIGSLNGQLINGKDASSPAERLADLMGRIDRLPPNGARELVHDCVAGLLELYGDGLSRILELLDQSGPNALPVRDALLRDKTVSALLLIHDLHPLDLETRLRHALEGLHPYMQSHGGSIEVVSVEEQVARLRFLGACKGCPSAAVTMELAVRRAVTEACPDLIGLEVEGVHSDGHGNGSAVRECGQSVLQKS
jgi:Fe-S cluster biogenesis protein NfuA